MSEKKKLLYVVRYPLYEGFHLKQKFDGQLNAFANLGFDVYFIGFDKEHFYLVNGENKTVIGKTHFNLPNYFHTFLYVDMYNAAKNVIKKYGIDYVYYRSAASFKSLYDMVKVIKENSVKFLFEIPTYLPDSKEKDLSFARSVVSKYLGIWGKKIETLPDIYVFMGDGNFTTFKGTKAIRIENGIAPELMPMKKPSQGGETLNILALSSMCDWHGYDRLIRSLAEYQVDKDIVIHMVGNDDGGCLEGWKSLAEQLNLGNKVVFHGALYGDELNEIFDLCDIGVNSLGMYRKGMNDTSELKTREYIARGLPFVSSVYDVVLDGLENDLYLMLTNDDSVPSMQAIVEFAEKVGSDSTASSRLRNHALSSMTWESQYKKVFERLEKD